MLSRILCVVICILITRHVRMQLEQLVDCDKVDNGCGGGWPPKTYREIKRMGGLEAQRDYPYIAKKQKCKLDESKLLAKIDGSFVLERNEHKQAAWLAENGPLATTLNANYLKGYFRLYRGDGTCGIERVVSSAVIR
ncbi:cathepsin F [Paragonimus westermani]|uniref:Cathepsin F n=1 Tax=Paragonimus westermani TaxID=34504 RepID=A0A5J4N5L7_9TREM|nr:cathepsin F [Paragonimus westermani]